MEFPKPPIKIEGTDYELLSYDEFRLKRGLPDVPNQTLINHLDRGTLDFTIIGRFRYIIWNDKARLFNLNYQKQLN